MLAAVDDEGVGVGQTLVEHCLLAAVGCPPAEMRYLAADWQLAGVAGDERPADEGAAAAAVVQLLGPAGGLLPATINEHFIQVV